MTPDEAVASSLFDMPDEPGMVRIPISLDVMIPNHLLQAPEPEPAADRDPVHGLNGVPPKAPGSTLRRRFGNHPEGIAARNVMDSFKLQISPAAVAPVPGVPATVAAAAGLRASRPAASVPADSTGGLLDAGAQAELRGLALAAERGAMAVGRGAVAGPLGAAVAGALLPTPTVMDDRPLAMRELAKARGDTGGLAASTGLDGARAR